MKSLFLCESCGKTVSPNAQRCPYCGRFFTAVVCPSCRYTGIPEEFLPGCPKCGYLNNETAKTKRNTGRNKAFILSKKKKPLIILPPWFYIIGGILLFITLLTLITWYLISLS
ncbi:MAG: zinc-ribbon domain-containing protein [Spirochaetales bacterium]|nr:zinc-ribbon domain-containing protein [Spirochaetales bacterium]